MLIFTREQDLPHIFKTLQSMFASTTYGMGYSSREALENSNSRRLYVWQTDFAYRLNDIFTAPNYIKPRLINNCFDYVKSIEAERNAEQSK